MFKNMPNFRWWTGKVEDVDDPKMLGRLKVRIFNLHDDDSIDTSDLPWARPSCPITSSNLEGIGESPTGIAVDSVVWGFFYDGEGSQIPIYVGVLAFIPGDDDKKHSVSQLARGTNSIKKELVEDEPESAYGAEYPHNKVLTTKSGHAIEIDDTPGAERIHIYHKSGSYTEINSEGQTVFKSVGESFHLVADNETVYIDGDSKVHVTGDINLTVDGDLNGTVSGDATIIVDGTTTFDSPSVETTGNLKAGTGASGSFTSPTGQIITVQDGIIINIF
jgi:hypothetical protein